MTAGVKDSPKQGMLFEDQRDRFIYDDMPMLVYWESTRSCDLACIHCRAEANPKRHPLELSTAEARALLDEIARFSVDKSPHLVITGGDPLQREDLFELIEYGTALGISISVTPAGTVKLTKEKIKQFKGMGVSSMALSLDGSDADRHDSFRRVSGSFDWTIRGASMARAESIPIQINTMVTAQTLDDLPNIYERLKEMGIARWALFFLIAVGRGRDVSEVPPASAERFLNWLSDLAVSGKAPFPIKTTEAHHFRRIAHSRLKAQGLSDDQILTTPIGRGFGIRDGNGIVFVSHIGQVYPSGFLPLAAGNVRSKSLTSIYCRSELFTRLREPDALNGKCGQCPFRLICGGSRARAYTTTGDPLESDPLCPYQPRIS